MAVQLPVGDEAPDCCTVAVVVELEAPGSRAVAVELEAPGSRAVAVELEAPECRAVAVDVESCCSARTSKCRYCWCG